VRDALIWSRATPLGHQSGLIRPLYDQEVSEISLRAEQLETDEVKVVCFSFVSETKDPPPHTPHFQTP
jgi:hypothetical protein